MAAVRANPHWRWPGPPARALRQRRVSPRLLIPLPRAGPAPALGRAQAAVAWCGHCHGGRRPLAPYS
eukprot:9933399-Alexandrium_andersonii.AAC.1